MNPPFYIHKHQDYILIIGSFQSGTEFEKNKQILQESSTINLEKVVFMDSETMNFIKNYSGNVIFDKQSYVYSKFKDKFQL